MNAVQESPPIQMLDLSYDVSYVLDGLAEHPEFWDLYTMRTDRADTPHKKISDIWFRFNDPSLMADPWAFTMQPHESQWYNAAHVITPVKTLVHKVMRDVGGRTLGGVLMTRIPAGGKVLPHQDSGWHAEFYEKFCIQIKGDQDQAFHFDGYEVRAEPGQVYTFDNSKIHWVTNDSTQERISLIICIRRDHVKPDA